MISKYNHTVSELFESQVEKTPQYIAICDANIKLSYLSLNEKANQFAHALRKKNVTPGDFVGILLKPGIDFIISVLAIIKVGGVYLPLDAQAPKQRLTDIINDALPKIIITSEQYHQLLNEHTSKIHLIKSLHLESASYPTININPLVSHASPLCMMYTSGSTGQPKGVIIPHQAVVNLIKIEQTTKIKAKDHVAQFSNLAFDGSTFEIWNALLNGARLIIVPQETRQDHTKLKELIENQHIKHMFLPTGFFHQLIKSAIDTLNEVSVIVFGGEQVNTNLLKTFLIFRNKNKLPVTLINGYGPTEATCYTCYQKLDEHTDLDDEELSSIGKNIKNSRLYILDENKKPVTEGELYISGINLAISYKNCLIQNNEKFLINPFQQDEPFQTLYKTGDRVRRLPSGNLLCLGRLDDQVKIGGFRIHLNEIEQQLMKYPAISLAAVVVELSGGSHQMLSAYIVPSAENMDIHADDIRKFLIKTLPPYMLPAKYVLVTELPLNAVGKVDKKKLDALPHIDLSFHVDTSASNDIEKKIKHVWQHLLGRKVIDVNKNLFELGANSLLIAEACTQINQALQSELQVANIISYPSIRKLSRFLDGDIKPHVTKKIKPSASNEIAIIGMACRYPGAISLETYWHNICQGKDGLTRFNEAELTLSGHSGKLIDKNFIPVKGVLSDIDHFDANFFGFNPMDASITDPQHRLFLECAWEALEHACVAPNKYPASIISVFSGMSDSTYGENNLSKNNWLGKELNRFQKHIATSTSMLSTQVSYRLNLRGRSININTACSTGLVTVAQACQDLISANSDISLAGGVSIAVPQENGYVYQPGSIESPDGQCRPFDVNANGTVFSNGVGIVVLKRLNDAIANGDTIYAVINGANVNNDGSDKLGFMAPGTHGQMSCIRDAMDASGVKAEDIGFIEAHGTATALGDVIEVNALKAVFREQTDKKQFCALGSVKGNIGHTDVAAGIAGLIKVALCLYYQKIPPTLHFTQPNPAINLNESPFFINTQLIDWKTTLSKRYAGVSSFGVGGTNAHMILSEYPKESTSIDTLLREQVMIVSGKTKKALEENTKNLVEWLSDKSSVPNFIADVAYTLQTGRDDFQWRRYGVGKTIEEITKNLQQNAANICNENQTNHIVFMFPGQGMQYHGMATELMDNIPYFKQIVDEGVRLTMPYLNQDLLEIIRNPLDDRLKETQYAQPALFIIEYALAKLLIKYGIKPAALIGHSIGEYVAASLAGVMSFADAIALVCERGLLMASAPTGHMLAIECNAEEFANYQLVAPIELALHNSLTHCVASGSESDITHLEKHLLTLKKSYQRLNVSHAFHSQSMEKIKQQFTDIFSNITLSPPSIPILSNFTGDWLSTHDAMDPQYWYRHLRHTVQLCKGFEVLLTHEHSFFIEVGPGSSLSTFLKNMPYSKKPLITHTLPNHHRRQSDMYALFSAIGSLWKSGIDIDWSALSLQEKRQHLPIPTYAFQKQRYWVDPDKGRETMPGNPAIYNPVWSHQPIALDSMSLSLDALKNHSWIIFKDEKNIGDQLISLLQQYEIQTIIIEQSTIFNKISPTHFKINPDNKSHYVDVFNNIKTTLHNPVVLHLFSCTDAGLGLLSSNEIDKQLTLSFDSVLYLTQAYISQIGDSIPLKCLLLSIGTQQVIGTELMSPVNASLIGPCRVITQEHPLLTFKIIDLTLDEPSVFFESTLKWIINTCLQPSWDKHHPIVAYRNGYQWNLAYAKTKPQQLITRFKDHGIYLFTGGLGGISLSLCEVISKLVSKPTLILLARTPMSLESTWDSVLLDETHKDYKKIKAIKALQIAGATVLIYKADIAEFESVQTVIAQCKTKFGKIDGVIHAAGIAGSGLTQLKSKKMAHDVFMPKIYGTYNLARALEGLVPDFVVLMSSLIVLTGELGQLDYTAGNACLDNFALSKLFSAKFVVSLAWNTWRDIGMTIETARPKDVTFFDRGNDISPQQGQQLFLQSMQYSFSNMAISNLDLSEHTNKLALSPDTSPIKSTKISREALQVSKHYMSPVNEIERGLAELWQDALGIDVIGINDDFFSLGGHSLQALRLIEKINAKFTSKLSINHLYKESTISQLSKLILSGPCENIDIVVPLIINTKAPKNVFICHPASGMVYCFNSLVSQCPQSLSIYGLQDPSVSTGKFLYSSISSMAEAYLSALKKIQPKGPYFLMGYSFGGTIVYEIANLLKQQKEDIELLALIEGWSVFSQNQSNELRFKKMFHAVHPDLSINTVDLAWAKMQLLLNHIPTKMHQDMILFKANELFDDYINIDDSLNGWSTYNTGKITCHALNANHDTIINTENSLQIINFLQKNVFNNSGSK